MAGLFLFFSPRYNTHTHSKRHRQREIEEKNKQNNNNKIMRVGILFWKIVQEK